MPSPSIYFLSLKYFFLLSFHPPLLALPVFPTLFFPPSYLFFVFLFSLSLNIIHSFIYHPSSHSLSSILSSLLLFLSFLLPSYSFPFLPSPEIPSSSPFSPVTLSSPSLSPPILLSSLISHSSFPSPYLLLPYPPELSTFPPSFTSRLSFCVSLCLSLSLTLCLSQSSLARRAVRTYRPPLSSPSPSLFISPSLSSGPPVSAMTAHTSSVLPDFRPLARLSCPNVNMDMCVWDIRD